MGDKGGVDGADRGGGVGTTDRPRQGLLTTEHCTVTPALYRALLYCTLLFLLYSWFGQSVARDNKQGCDAHRLFGFSTSHERQLLLILPFVPEPTRASDLLADHLQGFPS